MIPLSMANVGEKNIVAKVTGKDEVRQRLAELGVVVGGEIKVVSKVGANMIVAVKDSRVALDSSMINRIMV